MMLELVLFMFVITPLAIAMAFFVSGQPILFWRFVLALCGEPMPERHSQIQAHIDASRRFADACISVRDTLAFDVEVYRKDRATITNTRYQAHRSWSQMSGLWPDTQGGLSTRNRSGPEPQIVRNYRTPEGVVSRIEPMSPVEFGDTLCNPCARRMHNKCHGEDYCDCDCITVMLDEDDY